MFITDTFKLNFFDSYPHFVTLDHNTINSYYIKKMVIEINMCLTFFQKK